MRLIDADNLRTWFGEKDIYGYDYIIGTIDDAPTIEPERKNGKWTVYESQDGLIRRCTCSECGFTTHGKTWVNPNYCPKCGAEMRGEQNEQI